MASSSERKGVAHELHNLAFVSARGGLAPLRGSEDGNTFEVGTVTGIFQAMRDDHGAFFLRCKVERPHSEKGEEGYWLREEDIMLGARTMLVDYADWFRKDEGGKDWKEALEDSQGVVALRFGEVCVTGTTHEEWANAELQFPRKYSAAAHEHLLGDKSMVRGIVSLQRPASPKLSPAIKLPPKKLCIIRLSDGTDVAAGLVQDDPAERVPSGGSTWRGGSGAVAQLKKRTRPVCSLGRVRILGINDADGGSRSASASALTKHTQRPTAASTSTK